MKQTSIALAALLFTIGCSSGESEAAAVAAPTPAAPAGAAGNATLSPAYLAGPWCYRYYEAGGERSDENIDYVFNADGTLLYQNSQGAAVDTPGVWTLEDGQLSVGPNLWVITKGVHTVDDGRFVLGNGSVRVVFERGTCTGEATS